MWGILKIEKDNNRRKSERKVYKKILLWAMISIAVFLIFICPALNWLNKFDTLLHGWFVIKADVSDWFAFWGSFSGTIATVLVGIITMKLTEQIETDNRKKSELQKQMSIVSNMPSMVCENIEIYSINRGDITGDHVSRFKESRNYCFFLELSPAFPPYFDIKITEYQLEIQEKGQSVIIDGIQQEVDYSFTNHKSFKLYINADEKADSFLEHLYDLRLENTNATPAAEKNMRFRLRFECNNALLPGEEGAVYFDMVLLLESVGKGEKGVNLKTNNIQFVKV